jgi:5-methylcytosine-specific restriction protein A
MLSKARPSAAARGYGPRWRKTSSGWLLKHPWCADPYKVHQRFPEPADCTDHIIPHKGNMALFWDPKNWQSLCGTCHSRKTASEEGGFGNDVRGQKAVPAGMREGVPSTGAG